MTIKTAIEHLDKNATDEVFWLGPVDLEQIDILENNLGIKLPLDFKVLTFGWRRRCNWRGDLRSC
jgi:hypothetical protein